MNLSGRGIKGLGVKAYEAREEHGEVKGRRKRRIEEMEVGRKLKEKKETKADGD